VASRGTDVDYAFDDPREGWYGMAEPVDAGDEDSVDTDRWTVRDMDTAAASWESRLSGSGAWDFKPASGVAWYRSRVLAMVAATLAIAAAVLGAVVLFSGPATVVERPTVGPSTLLSPTSGAPTLSSQAPVPPPPPLPPPPPVPSAEEMNPPPSRPSAPRYQTPDEPKRPQMDVTRAPMSASPPVLPRPPDRNSATPGDARRHGLFG
jgi:hypothetical protein